MSRALSVPKRLMTPYVACTFRAKKTDDDIWRMRILFQEYRRIKIRKIFSKSSFQNKIEKLQKRLLFILIMLIWVFFIVFWTFSRCNFLLQFFSCIDLYTSFLQSDIKNLYQIWIKEVQIIKKWKNINKNTLITMSFFHKLHYFIDDLFRLAVANPQSTFCRVISSFSLFGTARKKAAVFYQPPPKSSSVF